MELFKLLRIWPCSIFPRSEPSSLKSVLFPALAQLHNKFILCTFFPLLAPPLPFVFKSPLQWLCHSLPSHPMAQKHKCPQSQIHKCTDINIHANIVAKNIQSSPPMNQGAFPFWCLALSLFVHIYC